MFLISICREKLDLGVCMTSILAKRMRPRSADFRFKNVCLCLAAEFVGSWHCAAAFSLQVPKSCTHIDPTFLYISILKTYTKFARKNKMLLERWPQVCCVKIMFELLPNNWFVSTKTNSMKCFVNWIPANSHVGSNKT